MGTFIVTPDKIVQAFQGKRDNLDRSEICTRAQSPRDVTGYSAPTRFDESVRARRAKRCASVSHRLDSLGAHRNHTGF